MPRGPYKLHQLDDLAHRFADAVARGTGPLAAYRAVYKPGEPPQESDRHKARDLMRRKSVAEYVARVKPTAEAKAAESATLGAAISRDFVLRGLLEVYERSMQRAPVLDSRGRQKQTDTPDGERADAWQYDGKVALGALTLMGRELGMFEAKHQQRDPFEHADDAALSDMIARGMRQWAELTGRTMAALLDEHDARLRGRTIEADDARALPPPAAAAAAPDRAPGGGVAIAERGPPGQ